MFYHKKIIHQTYTLDPDLIEAKFELKWQGQGRNAILLQP